MKINLYTDSENVAKKSFIPICLVFDDLCWQIDDCQIILNKMIRAYFNVKYFLPG